MTNHYTCLLQGLLRIPREIDSPKTLILDLGVRGAVVAQVLGLDCSPNNFKSLRVIVAKVLMPLIN